MNTETLHCLIDIKYNLNACYQHMLLLLQQRLGQSIECRKKLMSEAMRLDMLIISIEDMEIDRELNFITDQLISINAEVIRLKRTLQTESNISSAVNVASSIVGIATNFLGIIRVPVSI
ncbi:MAG: hypothetical protein WBM66_06045 [Thiothrix litoralis]|jgi:hypothetical protein